MSKIINPILEEAHCLYNERGRIVRRLDRMSLKSLRRFADILESMSDEHISEMMVGAERETVRVLERVFLKDGSDWRPGDGV